MGTFPSVPEVENLSDIVRNHIRKGSVESGYDGISIRKSDFVGSFHGLFSVSGIYIIHKSRQMSIGKFQIFSLFPPGSIEVSHK